MSENEFQSGDRVIIDPEYVTKSLRGRVFEVVRRMKVNYELRAARRCRPQFGGPPWGDRARPQGTVGEADRGGHAL